MTMISRRSFSRTLAGSLTAAVAYSGYGRETKAAGRLTDAADAPGPIFLNYNENPYGPTAKARAALANCAAIANRYPDAAADELRGALARKHNVGPENIVLGCGSTEILKCADSAFLTPQTNVVACTPTFEAILEYAEIGGSNAVTVAPTADHREDLQKMAAACTSKTGLAYVCNPNNPTGTIVSRDEMAAFVRSVSPGTLILVDEAYFEFADAPAYGTAIELIGEHPNVLVARTFSKIYGMAGLRLGYGVGNKTTVELVTRHRTQDSANAAALAAAMASLADPEGLTASRDKLVATRNWMCDQLKSDGRAFISSQANFVMIDLGTDTKPVIAQFANRNVFVGRRFPSMPTFLRVTIGTQSEIETFVAALRQILPSSAGKAA
jgi:histidinol-phosphate aminotransferase